MKLAKKLEQELMKRDDPTYLRLFKRARERCYSTEDLDIMAFFEKELIDYKHTLDSSIPFKTRMKIIKDVLKVVFVLNQLENYAVEIKYNEDFDGDGIVGIPDIPEHHDCDCQFCKLKGGKNAA